MRKFSKTYNKKSKIFLKTSTNRNFKIFSITEEGEEGVNIENEVPRVDGSVSPASTHSMEVTEVQTTTPSMLKLKSSSSQPRIKVKPETQSPCNRSPPSLVLQQSMHNSNESAHDDLEQNIPATLIDHDTGAKQ